MPVRLLDKNNPKDVDKIVDFPYELYKNNPQWVPPLVSSAKKVFNRERHPYYEHSIADFFIVEENNRTLGRIAVMENRNFNNYRNTKTAFFGLLDVIEDQNVSELLFSAAFEWARTKGLDSIIGPRGFNGTEAAGILVEGFQHRPAMNIPYNFQYYDELIKLSGFSKDTDHLSGYLPGDYELPERLINLAEKVKERRGLWVKSFKSKAEIREWVPRVAEVHSIAFANSHTYFPPTPAETEMISESIIQIADPGLVKVVMKNEAVIGFIISYHDISAALQRSRGRIWPTGWYWLLTERGRTKWANVNGMGLIPEYQGLGANVVLYTELAKTLKSYGFHHADIVQINEVNRASIADMENVGVHWYKRHRAYKREL